MADVDAQVGRIGKPEIPSTAIRSGKDAACPPLSIGFCLTILTLMMLFTRVGYFNNPLTHVDDQFYLYTGKAMLGGDLPYVDIWDRKPIGLFLIYAGMVALGGDSVIVYHLVAAAAALATSIAIFFLAKRFASDSGALRAGIAYLALLPTMGGAGGQSPVFYNLLIAVAALLTFAAMAPSTRRWMRMAGAMALVGLAIQIKPTTLFEGAFLALVAMTYEWRDVRSIRRVALLAAMMAGLAIAPTVAAFATYAMLGHADEMWFATVASIFMRTPIPWADRFGDVPQMLFFLLIPALIAASALATRFKRHGRDAVTLFLAGWAVAAMIGFLSVPNFFNHYTLPLILPLCVIMAPLLGDRRDGMIFLVMAITVPIIFEFPSIHGIVHNREGFDRNAALIKRSLHGGCLYVFYGPTQFYSATNSCHLSPYVFPDHLETTVESSALPVSPEAEVERIFRQRPTVVITGKRYFLTRNLATGAIADRHLRCDYFPLRTMHIERGRTLEIWALKPGPRPPCPTIPLSQAVDG